MLLAQQDSRHLIDLTFAPLFEDHGIPLAVMGICVVFMALILIAVLITLLPRLLESASSAVEAIEPLTEEEIDRETLVVIAAAVAETIRQPHRVVRIRGLTSADLDWSLEGRLQHHQSHRIQPRDPR